VKKGLSCSGTANRGGDTGTNGGQSINGKDFQLLLCETLGVELGDKRKFANDRTAKKAQGGTRRPDENWLDCGQKCGEKMF